MAEKGWRVVGDLYVDVGVYRLRNVPQTEFITHYAHGEEEEEGGMMCVIIISMQLKARGCSVCGRGGKTQ